MPNYHYVSAGSTNRDSQLVEACPTAAGQTPTSLFLTGIQLSNGAAAGRYVKIYDKATAPTSADTPVLTLQCGVSVPSNPHLPSRGVRFSLGIGIRITTGLADNDTGAASASDVAVNLQYNR